MRSWNRLDILLIGFALLVILAVLGQRVFQHQQLSAEAEEVHGNIISSADAVEKFFRNTNSWFPSVDQQNAITRVYNDPFNDNEVIYQGLDLTRLSIDANHGLVLQLVRYDSSLDGVVPKHLFETPFGNGDPYLRILTDYGSQATREAEVLKRVQSRLPAQSIAEVDDHLYIVDLRRLIHAK